MLVPSPMDEKCPILTGFISALITTLYQTVAHLLTITSPTKSLIKPAYGNTQRCIRSNPSVVNLRDDIIKRHHLSVSRKFLSVSNVVSKSAASSIKVYSWNKLASCLMILSRLECIQCEQTLDISFRRVIHIVSQMRMTVDLHKPASLRTLPML